MNLLKFVTEKLKLLEEDYNIKILLAVETGDKALGLNPPNALSTVRFIYKSPIERYLTFTELFDTIEWVTDEVEFYGIDLRKAVRMITESNRNTYEWINSKIKYIDCGFTDRIAPVLEKYFSVEKILLQEKTVIRNQLEGLSGDRASIYECIMLEKTFMQIKWILDNRTMPPIDINKLIRNSPITDQDRYELTDLIKNINEGCGSKWHILQSTFDLAVKQEYDEFLRNLSRDTIARLDKTDLTIADNFFLQEIWENKIT